MSGFKFNSDLLIGKSSDLDAVFLPVNVDHHHQSDPGPPSWEHSGNLTNGLEPSHQVRQGHHTSTPSSTTTATTGKDAAHHHHHHHQVLVEEEDEEDGKDSGGSKLVQALITNSPNSSDWCYRATLISMAIIVLIVLLLAFGFTYIQRLLLWLEQVETWQSVVVLMALFCLISFPLAWGLSLLMVVCGYLYGIYGPLVVTLNLTVCLAISMPVMRGMCSDYLHSRFYSRKVEAIINIVSGPHGMKVIALTRLTPIPFGLQNALFSLSSISLVRYLISSVGGFIPMTLLNCYMGSTLRTMHDLLSDDSNRMTGYFIFGGQILVTVILLWFVVRKARVELKKAMDESDTTPPDLPNGDCSKTVFVNGDL